MGRYAEAEQELLTAVAKDWYDATAHVERGALLLQLGEDHSADASQEFRQALAIDPTLGAAAIGLSQALDRASDDMEGEFALREILRRQDSKQRWRVHLALARLMIRKGDKQHSSELYAEAYGQAQSAIGSAPDAEADPHFMAGLHSTELALRPLICEVD
jgi:Flp pilus assembly protein TadD